MNRADFPSGVNVWYLGFCDHFLSHWLSRYNSPSCQGDIHSKIPYCSLCASSDGISISSPCLFITNRLALSWCGNVTLKPAWFFFFFYIKFLYIQLLLFKDIKLLSLFPSLFVIGTASWILRFFSWQCRPRNFLGRCWYFL